MSFVKFALYNDSTDVVQLQVFDDVDPNNKLVIFSPDYPNTSPFPLVASGTTAQLSATALSDGGSSANVEWNANPVNQQPLITVQDGKTYSISNGEERQTNEQTRRLKDLEQENANLKRLVSELSLEKLVLKDIASENF